MATSTSGSLRGLSVLDDLDIRDIPEGGLAFDEAIPEAWVDARLEGGHGLSWSPRGPGHVDLRVEALGPVDQAPPIRLSGSLRAEVETDCVRCLTAVHQRLECSIELTLFSASAADAVDDEMTSGDEGRYDRGVIPLPEILRELLLIELDMNPTCEDVDACDARTRALLDQANRPVRELEAAQGEAIDPRWAPLLGLKTDSSD